METTGVGGGPLAPFDVFLASPGDVGEERALADDVVRQVNETLGRRLNVAVRLTKWEIQPPGGGRPQERINPRVRSCDLFVGLVWQRWGSPTGEYASGFEEEFSIASSRYESGESVELALYVRQPTLAQQADPGRQMRQVNAFLKRVRNDRRLLYDTYTSPQEFGYKFYDLLAGHLLDRTRIAPASEGATGAVGSSREPSAEDGVVAGITVGEVGRAADALAIAKDDEPVAESRSEGAGSKVDVGVAQSNRDTRFSASASIADALERVRNFLVSGDRAEPGDFDRLQLFSGATRSFSSGDLIPADLAVRTYHLWASDRLTLSPLEADALLRATVAGVLPWGTVAGPGWFGSTAATQNDIADRLASMAATDSSSAVRRAALSLLHTARMRPATWWTITEDDEVPPGLLALLASDLVEDGLAYIRDAAEPADGVLLDRLANITGQHGRVEERQKLLALAASMSGDVAAVRQALLDPATVEMVPDRLIESAAIGADSPIVDELLRLPGAPALATLNALSTAAKLTADQVYLAASNDDLEVRRCAVELTLAEKVVDVDGLKLAELIEQSRFGPQDMLLAVRVLAGMVPENELRRRSVQLTDLGPESYSALALRDYEAFRRVRDDLRKDLEPQFERALEAVTVAVPTERAHVEQLLRDQLEGLHDSLISRWRLAALIALAERPAPGNAALVLPSLLGGGIWEREAAALALQDDASASDALDDLLTVAMRYHDPAVLRIVGRIAADSEAMVDRLLASDDDRVSFAVLDEMLRRDLSLDRINLELRRWMTSQSRVRRLRAATELVRHADALARRALLDEYLAGPYYYYDVVGLLDRSAFAPSPINEAFSS